ncbi:biotin--[acetyl-CoA-carboxylase] ligase [Actinophytocola algeriensis]|uniref:biotin--[biotin carboxyl-carrier protein] ligase n=1 Tax=Actinophytocola algeriensis TaxID=1768010 RepID=A0A7W7PYX1_9PSEU|nr:biotin--[acetyl-CoA-carboxylase] ligase [Actinophytocola algeriensis]MBB4903880.1 BirA family biotin operon repressor/biotin-[acetyl-CoA-carboxylase] ligase [Actinophytocola algeriensis]MBE1477263.1 BirA family biotin operon repressor/biotin-[acetyl-CoA-carboxylase] ligase [Actinophytocola algeriensis]
MTENKLDVLVLREQLVAPNGPYAALDVVASTGSTNADLLAAAAENAADRTVLVAEEQTAGRGRRDRTWVSPSGSGVYLSVLVRPSSVPPARLGTLGMVAGLALMHAATETAGIDAVLKWPNDLLVGAERKKAAGVLSEVVSDAAGQAAVVGVGFNVTALPEGAEPGPGGLPPGSFADAGAKVTDRTELTASFLRAFVELEAVWRLNDGDVERSGVLTGYREACGSIGQRVRAELPDGALTGVAVDVDPEGRLLLKLDDGTPKAVSAGDVVHLKAD